MLWPLFTAQRASGLQAEIAVGSKNSDHSGVHALAGRRLRWWELNFVRRVEKALSLQNCLYPSTLLLPYQPWFRRADIIHLHVTTYEFFNDLALPLLTCLKPVVWTLHDMQPLTGGCTHSFGCVRWRTGCGHCPGIGGHVYLRHDTTRLLWRLRRSIYRASKFTLVTPSKWLKGLLSESPLLERFDCHVIPNGLDLTQYKPQSQAKARSALGIPTSARVVICFGPNGYSQQYKGSEYVNLVLQSMDLGYNLVILLVGSDKTYDLPDTRYTQIRLGWVDSAARMTQLFSAADVTLAPSLADNSPGFVQESIACGTPVVGFATGGIPEIVRPPEAGLLVLPGDVRTFGSALRRLIEDADLRGMMRKRAREIAEREYSLDRCVRSYSHLYSSILSRRNASDGLLEARSMQDTGSETRCG